MKELVHIYIARADHVDLGHQDFFCQTVVWQKTRNSSEFNYQIPHAKQNYLKHSIYYRSINFWNKLPRDIKSMDSFHIFKRRLLDFYNNNNNNKSFIELKYKVIIYNYTRK